MAKLTPGQRAESMRRWHASRTPEERRAVGFKGYMTRQKNRGLTGRLVASSWDLDDEVDVPSELPHKRDIE